MYWSMATTQAQVQTAAFRVQLSHRLCFSSRHRSDPKQALRSSRGALVTQWGFDQRIAGMEEELLNVSQVLGDAWGAVVEDQRSWLITGGDTRSSDEVLSRDSTLMARYCSRRGRLLDQQIFKALGSMSCYPRCPLADSASFISGDCIRAEHSNLSSLGGQLRSRFSNLMYSYSF